MPPVLHWALTNPQLQAIKRIQITNLCKNKHYTQQHKKCITSLSITAGLHQMFHSPHISCCPNRLLPRPKLRNSLHKKSCNLQEDFFSRISEQSLNFDKHNASNCICWSDSDKPKVTSSNLPSQCCASDL